jgi:hypothetical protein
MTNAAGLDDDLGLFGAERPGIIFERLQRLTCRFRGPGFDHGKIPFKICVRQNSGRRIFAQ